MHSSLFSWPSLLEWFKGLLMAVFGAVVGTLYTILTTGGGLPTSWTDWWTKVLLPGAIAFLAYLIKTVFQNSQGVPFAKEPTK